MPNKPFSYSDETGFEQSTFVSTPKKSVSDTGKVVAGQVSQQAKAAAQDAVNQFLDALYGPSKPSSDQNTDKTAQSQNSQSKGQQSTTQQQQSSAEQTKQAESQKSTDIQKKYYESEIEQGIIKARREREEKEQQRAKEFEQEQERIQQEKKEQEEQLVVPSGKTVGAPGRNRKGQRPLAVRQAQTKGETGRNVVAG